MSFSFSRPVCANCRKNYNAEDKYCRYCGAPMGAPLYIDEGFPLIYGPAPIKRVHTCNKCGFEWETNLMVDSEKWCPKCGGDAPAKEMGAYAQEISQSDLEEIIEWLKSKKK